VTFCFWCAVYKLIYTLKHGVSGPKTLCASVSAKPARNQGRMACRGSLHESEMTADEGLFIVIWYIVAFIIVLCIDLFSCKAASPFTINLLTYLLSVASLKNDPTDGAPP